MPADHICSAVRFSYIGWTVVAGKRAAFSHSYVPEMPQSDTQSEILRPQSSEPQIQAYFECSLLCRAVSISLKSSQCHWFFCYIILPYYKVSLQNSNLRFVLPLPAILWTYLGPNLQVTLHNPIDFSGTLYSTGVCLGSFFCRILALLIRLIHKNGLSLKFYVAHVTLYYLWAQSCKVLRNSWSCSMPCSSIKSWALPKWIETRSGS